VEASLLETVDPLSQVLERDRHQPEHVLAIWDYLDRVVTEARVAEGRQRQVQAEGFDVPAPILTAIWGIETNFGAVRGDVPVLAALATLAWDGRRSAFFEGELVAALSIAAKGIAPKPMVGSWAGAMGHMQFMPTTWIAHGADADIWAEDPRPALGAAAGYLMHEGWIGENWGAPVRLPAGFDLDAPGDAVLQAADWAGLGVKTTCTGRLFLPAGVGGPAFVVGPGFAALRRYNPSDAYALAVGLLADRIAGGARPELGWPRAELPLSHAEMSALQAALTAAGFDTQGTDGIAGPNTRAAVRSYQRAQGLPADGYPGRALLSRLT
jgi:membrane-bound lytic murein transglycosylase B